MTEKRRSAKGSDVSASCDRQNSISSPEEERVWAALNRARQNVKPIVKKEKETEIATAELLNLRLKAL